MRIVNLIGENIPNLAGNGSKENFSIFKDKNEQMELTSDTDLPEKCKTKRSTSMSQTKKYNELEMLLIAQNKERHAKEMMLLDLKIENEIYSLIRRVPIKPGRLSAFCLHLFIKRRKKSR
jgi:hypothetical protein